MKTNKKMLAKTFALAIMGLGLSLSGCSKTESPTQEELSLKSQNCQDYSYSDTLPLASDCVGSLPYQDLSTEEKEALMQMREEEYLAFDVYTVLSGLYSKPVFRNIASSEFRHTEAIRSLILKYNLTDPGAGHIQGVFQNSDLQRLYTELIQTGSASLLQALTVGATVEDLDITDLKNDLSKTDNEDITRVFNNLMRGSRNHLRSFYRNITLSGGTYAPQYLTPDEFNAIINSAHETGSGN